MISTPGTYQRTDQQPTYTCTCARCEATWQLELDETQRAWQVPALLRKAGWAMRARAWHCPTCAHEVPIKRSH